jgi:hypothetical protein
VKNIIYSKYSNERAERFQIRTDILEDENGKKYVQKKAFTYEANTHINNIYINYKLLLEAYKDSKICINECNKVENGLEFEYIVGNTLEEKLDKLFFNKDYVQLVKKIEEYVCIIGKGIGENTFKPTKEFINVFGNVDLPSSLRAGDINDIDLVFNNIIVGQKWHVIDYEWTFDFPIPFNYIVYRAIRIYIEGSSKRNELVNLGLYKLLGITDNEIIQYNNMEINFQRYVVGDLIQLHKLYGQTTEMNLNIQQIIECERANLFKNTVQVFYDYGQGFSEENSYKFYPLLNGAGKVESEILITPNVSKIRIDPTNSNSIVNIDSIVGYTTKYYSIDYYTNGIKLSDKSTLFTNDDPQIILVNIKPETTKIELKFEVQTISKEITIRLCEFIEEKEKYIKDIIEEKEKYIKEVNDVIQEKENHIKEVNDVIQEKENHIKEANDVIQEKEKQIREVNHIIQEKEKYIKEIETSRSWIYLQKLKKIIGK